MAVKAAPFFAGLRKQVCFAPYLYVRHIVQVASYQESKVLARYLWNNYAYLFPLEDREVMKALVGEEKASQIDHAELAQRVRKMFGSVKAEKVTAALAEGEDTFQARICAELLHEKQSDIIINRCPSCACIVRTPRAKQCLWCSYDWH